MKCGMLQGGLTLNDRTFKRDGCGHVEDRDLHAARNLERCPGLQGESLRLWTPEHRPVG